VAVDEKYEWWGLLGPVTNLHPSGWIATSFDQNATLDARYKIGPLVVRPGERRLTEFLRSEPRSLAGVTRSETWPVIVEGNWPGKLIATDNRYEGVRGLSGQKANERVANSWLYRMATLLALAFDGEPWQVRNAAQDSTSLPAEVPEGWPELPDGPISLSKDIELVSRPLPGAMPKAWDELDDDTALASALTSWHQGRLLTTRFPSYALIAHCASIETLARSLRLRDRIKVEAVKCVACDNVPGAQATFWATAALVRGPDEIEELRSKSNPYTSRSKTAHASAIYGIEDSFGYEHMMKYVPSMDGQPGGVVLDENDSTQAFMWRTLPEIQRINADLLRLTLFSSEA
jgi:hypothetical protein